MPEPLHPTNENWELFDPEVHPPPRGVSLLVINEGGVLLISQWYEGALAWGFKPKIPASVKQRVSKKQQQQCEASNADQSKSGAVDPFDPEWLKLELPV